MAKPIKLNTHKILIDAPRELVFQMLSSIGRGKMKDDNNESSRIILPMLQRIMRSYGSADAILKKTRLPWQRKHGVTFSSRRF